MYLYKQCSKIRCHSVSLAWPLLMAFILLFLIWLNCFFAEKHDRNSDLTINQSINQISQDQFGKVLCPKVTDVSEK